jgi:hypothetical protein
MSDLGAQGLVELARENRVVGICENGEVVYQVPASSLEKLDQMSIPYEILASGLSSPVGPTGMR